ncbi:MAG: VOC family protein [Moheibacter sp.]
MKLSEKIEFILYVDDQQKSTEFYTKLFRKEPVLNVPGMTEFQLTENSKLGLMPNSGIQNILQNQTPNPASGNGIPRCELYLFVENLKEAFENALHTGAKPISPIEERNWGDSVCYFADLDGHILAFAKSLNS